jgi:acyl-coenzyme A thioesterase 13
VQEKHTNARGTLHGGVLASIADVALGYGLATSTSTPTSMVTASLSVDFAGSAKVGDWIETSLDIQKVGSRMAFANVYFVLRGERIARASGVFLVTTPAT